MATTATTPKNLRTRREQLRNELVRLGLRPREAAARADIAQLHLSDYQGGRTGVPA